MTPRKDPHEANDAMRRLDAFEKDEAEKHKVGYHRNWHGEYLRLLSEGMRHSAAANQVGMRPNNVTQFKKSNIEFAERCKVAEEEGQSLTLNLVEEMLLEKILVDRHFPAIVFFLVNMGRGKWRDIRQIALTSQDEIGGQDAVAKDILSRLKAKSLGDIGAKLSKVVDGE